ncbi:hypothetical protein [Methylocaldum sp.]|nr:hypothetical protein [Methylocaldum sp.]HYE35678.1 hypothetical protein [Methylocaldum sp.]
MKKLIALGLITVSLALGGCQNETTPSSPGGSPGAPQQGETPGER